MKTIYTATMTNTGARTGQAVSPDGSFVLNMVKPVEMGGDGSKKGTDPEELFAATYSSCFNGALTHILTQAKAEYESTSVRADISLVQDPEDNGFRIAAVLTVSIMGMPIEKAEKYTQMAHKFCPYSKAIKGNVDVELKVI